MFVAQWYSIALKSKCDVEYRQNDTRIKIKNGHSRCLMQKLLEYNSDMHQFSEKNKIYRVVLYKINWKHFIRNKAPTNIR